MSEEPVEQQRRTMYEIAEAIAPTWERRRDFVETASAPVRSWMLAELAPQRAQRVLEVAAGGAARSA